LLSLCTKLYQSFKVIPIFYAPSDLLAFFQVVFVSVQFHRFRNVLPHGLLDIYGGRRDNRGSIGTGSECQMSLMR